MARPIGLLGKTEAEWARHKANAARSKHPRGGSKESYVQSGLTYDTKPKYCKCGHERSWNSGQETCIKCGKLLPTRPRVVLKDH